MPSAHKLQLTPPNKGEGMSSYLFSHSIEKLGCLKLALEAFATLRILNFLPFFVTLLLLPA